MDNIQLPIVNEVIVTGRKKRRLIDKTAKLWQRLSYWTKACDVEFDDGKTAQEKLGNINGITSDINIIGSQEGKDMVVSVYLLKEEIIRIANELKQAFQDGYEKIIGALIAIGIITPEEGKGLSPDDIADLIKNNTGDFKYYNMVTGGDGNAKTISYSCPKDGYYNIYADYSAYNNDNHNAVSNNVTLKIGNQTTIIYNHSPLSGASSGTGKFYQKIYCKKNTKIILSVNGTAIPHKSDSTPVEYATIAYTVGVLAIT